MNIQWIFIIKNDIIIECLETKSELTELCFDSNGILIFSCFPSRNVSFLLSLLPSKHNPLTPVATPITIVAIGTLRVYI